MAEWKLETLGAVETENNAVIDKKKKVLSAKQGQSLSFLLCGLRLLRIVRTEKKMQEI